MKRTNFNLQLLVVVFVTSLIISNVVTGKLVNTHLYFGKDLMVLPGAMFCYALTFLVTDVIGELWGKDQANNCVKMGLFAQIIATCLIMFTKFLPAYDAQMQEAYNKVLGQNYIYVLASLTAYWCAQSWDVWIFHKVRDYFKGDSTKRWIWNNVSTLTSQMIDTAIFITIAFGIGYGWIFKKEMIGMLVLMIIGQYLFKAILAILDTPFFYLLTRRKR